MSVAHISKFSTLVFRCEYFILGIKIRVGGPMQFNIVATAMETEKVIIFICPCFGCVDAYQNEEEGGEVCLHIHVSI